MNASATPLTEIKRGSVSGCVECGKGSLVALRTYKRDWYLCGACGTGFPRPRDFYPLSFLPFADLKRRKDQDEQSIYDYFVLPDHARLSKLDADAFLKQCDDDGVSFDGKRVLDVSGGSGFFLKEIERRGARVALTEFNKKAVEFARRTHGFEAYEFDFNRDCLRDVVPGQFDIVMLRAAIMFCDDLDALAAGLLQITKPGARILIVHSVVPTLGTLLRVQLDEFSYRILRQPETVAAHFERQGYRLEKRIDEIDPSPYVNDYDMKDSWLFVRALYEISGARRLRAHRKFAFAARDRRRSKLIVRRPS
jgi:SAM-dependent methyltransferase